MWLSISTPDCQNCFCFWWLRRYINHAHNCHQACLWQSSLSQSVTFSDRCESYEGSHDSACLTCLAIINACGYSYLQLDVNHMRGHRILLVWRVLQSLWFDNILVQAHKTLECVWLFIFATDCHADYFCFWWPRRHRNHAHNCYRSAVFQRCHICTCCKTEMHSLLIQIIGSAGNCNATSSGAMLRRSLAEIDVQRSCKKHASEVLECNIIRCYAETLSSSHRRAHIDINMRLRSMAKTLAFR